MNVLFWLRQDLRLSDNLALKAALSAHPKTVTFLYVLPKSLGSASRWWLHHSLKAFDASLQQYGHRLFLSNAPEEEIILRLVAQKNIQALYCTQRHEPALAAADALLFQKLRTVGVSLEAYPGYLLHNPEKVLTGQGKPYQKYTPFWKASSSGLTESVLKQWLSKAPSALPPSLSWHQEKNIITVDQLDTWQLCPRHPNWALGFEKTWIPGEVSAQKRLLNFIKNPIQQYATQRDFPGNASGTSRLSPHLHFGEISPHRIYHTALSQPVEETYLKELVWREFSYHLLHHFKALPEQPLNPLFKHFPWHSDKKSWTAWTKGETGYPIVDAGMRELWTTGWMHNRVRMIVASFLVKDLFIPWQSGAEWFLDTLVDADLASNSASWQWVAGCGADAAPYFRIFNPTLQGKKFDPEGTYVKRWIPELAHVSPSEIHEPWVSNLNIRHKYPKPIVDHAVARDKALHYYQQIKQLASK
ncbi:MAG: hypothetical protein RLZ35_1121 [Pseudomonadota bacterium]